MSLIFDENSLVNDQMYKYDKYIHSRINKYTDAGRTLVTYYNINDSQTSTSLGMRLNYQILGNESPLRYDKIENMILVAFSSLSPEDSKLSNTDVKDYNLSGEAYVLPGTVMPKENDFFIVNHINMNHIFRVTQVTQDGLNTDGSYKIMYSLFSTNPSEIKWVEKQTTNNMVMDLQTIGGTDLTPVIGKEDYDHRSKLIQMVDDMVENYVARYYNQQHNCFMTYVDGVLRFDMCANVFMAKHGVMINDRSNGNIVLNPDKINDPRLQMLYQKSPFKWIERDAPLRYLESFKYHTMKAYNYVESSFAMYGTDVDVMIPNDPWCESPQCDKYFPDEVLDILMNEHDIRSCNECDCRCCKHRYDCYKHFKCKRHDYVSLIHDFIHGKLTSIKDLSPYIGDQLFDNNEMDNIYLWTPMIIYIIKRVLKMK